jgi:hypothetical protein
MLKKSGNKSSKMRRRKSKERWSTWRREGN